MLTINNTLDGYLKDVEIKGNTVQDSENLADIKSVGDKVEGQELYEIPVLSCGKNLFDGSINRYDARVSTFNGYNYECAGYSTTNYIKVKGNTPYTVQTGQEYYYAVYDKDKKHIGGNKSSSTIWLSEEVEYIRFDFVSSNINTIQIEEGTQATPYEPYVEDKLTILSPVQLEKVGDVADRIIEKDGVWGVEKNVVTKVLNGNEDVWHITNNGKYLKFGNYDVCVDAYFTPHSTQLVISDKFITGVNSSGETTQEQVMYYCHGDLRSELRISILASKVSSTGFEGWLKDNNVTIKYRLAQPIFIPLPHDQQIKLRTFANKTNISFLTEIEGTIKAQVPKSIGATVNTHTEQINNLNKELDRVKKLEESTVSTVTTESDFTTVEATSNGYFEDVKLEGKTIKNLLGSNGRNSVSLNQSLKSKLYTLLEPIPANTDIFIRISVTAKKAPLNGLKINVMNEDGSYSYFTGFNGVYDQCLKITHDKNIIKLGFYMPQGEFDNDSMANITYEKAQVTLVDVGTSYFEGLKSVGQSATTSEDGVDEIVVSSVKSDGNLLMPLHTGVTTGSYNKNNITFSSDYSMSYVANAWGQGVSVDVVGVVKGETYVILCDTNTNMCIKSTNALNTTGDIQIHSNKAEIVATSTGIGTIEFKNATETGNVSCTNLRVIKKGSKEEFSVLNQDKKRLLYYNEETQTWEKPILREGDSIEKHANGKYYYHQRSAEVVLNGSENWNNDKNSSTMSPATYRQSIQFDAIDIPNAAFNTKTSPNIISDLLPTVIFGDVYSYNHIGISISGTDNIGTHIIINNNFTDVTELKQWLQANNLTLVYQLAEEKVYECTNIDLITYTNETNFIVESGVLSPKTTLKVHNNISNVVRLLQKKVSLLESNVTSYMTTQNRLMLASRYNSDTVSFKVDYAVYSENMSQENYDTDLYNLILNNILVGKDNYDYDHMFNIIMDYASWSQISWDQFDILVGLMDIQHNPPIEEIPTDDEIVEEIPNEIM